MAWEISIYCGGKGIAKQSGSGHGNQETNQSHSHYGQEAEKGYIRRRQGKIAPKRMWPELSSAFYLLLLLVTGIRLLTCQVINSS